VTQASTEAPVASIDAGTIAPNDHTGGYPYAIQRYGDHAWHAAAGQPQIDLPAAERAVVSAGAELELGLYASRWAHTSRGERTYLAGVAELLAEGATPTGRSVADRLGTRPQQLSMVRARLIKKGTLVARGEALDFSVPGMAGYVHRHGLGDLT
jgi:hypothetical protein